MPYSGQVLASAPATHGTEWDAEIVAQPTERASGSQLVVVASRLPFTVGKADGKGPSWVPAPGGVASALSSALKGRACTWIGWPGVAGALPDGLPEEHGAVEIRPIALSQREVTHFYERYSNAALWPALHETAPTSVPDSADWSSYREVNERFAEEAAEVAALEAVVWVHDYQLMLVPRLLRQLRPDLKIGFFLHTPMPRGRHLAGVKESRRLIDGLLGADLIGMQTPRDVLRFVAQAGRRHPVTVSRHPLVHLEGRQSRCAVHPISVDAKSLAAAALHPRVQERARQIRAHVGRGRTIVLGVDRLDYTKGIPARLDAFTRLIEDGSLSADEAVFVQVAAPSRVGVSGYAEARRAVEHAVARVAATTCAVDPSPVVYLPTHLSKQELLAYYLAADVLCVTPLRDGMNLIAKEFVAVCSPDAAVVLSAEAGAAAEFDSAWLVDPADVADIKRGLFEALRADTAEREARVRVMRHRLEQNDVHSWASGFLDMLGDHDE